MEHKQSSSGVVIAVSAYTEGPKVADAFGKLDLYARGVLPVLVVIENTSAKAIRLDRMSVAYQSGRTRVEETPAKDVRYLNGPERPKSVPGPGGREKIIKPKKNPFDVWEVEGRAFAAKMLAPGQTASGFVYFQASLKPDATIYITGLREAATDKELFYFEVPLY
jgi:hypothetical protein